MRGLVVLSLLVSGCAFELAGLAPDGNDAGRVGGGGPSPAEDAGGVTEKPDLVASVDLLGDPCLSLGMSAPGTTATCVVGQAPAIDGDLRDWPTALFVEHVQHRSAAEYSGFASGAENDNDANSSASLALRWDLDNLYLAVRVEDDARSFPSGFQPRGDALELFLGALPPALGGSDPSPMRLIVNPKGEAQLYQDNQPPSPLPSGVKIAASSTMVAAGWQVEAAIPWSLLGATRVPAGFDVALDDADPGSLRGRYLLWKNQAPNSCLCANSLSKCRPTCSSYSLQAIQLGGR